MPPVIKRTGDLEIPEDLPHRRREWLAERNRLGGYGLDFCCSARRPARFGRVKPRDCRAAGIPEAAREMQGLERIDQIKYAALERGGGITVVSIDKKA